MCAFFVPRALFAADPRSPSPSTTPTLIDPRPWEEQGPSFTDPTRAEWAAALAQARDLVADPANRIFGLPDATSPTGVRPAVSIYAWNEFGEGGILAPTAGAGFMKLEVLGAVFGGGGE